MKTATVTSVALVVCFLGQAVLSWSIKDIRPTLGILPDLISQDAADALSFGDGQFLYRYLALQLQNAGDNGGRITPLKNYDYDAVVDWLELLEQRDLRSHWSVAMANGYFGQTPTTEDVRPIVRFIQAHVARDPDRKWPWLVNAVYLARHRLQDDWVALDAARQLSNYDYANMNAVSLQMPAMVRDDLGQYARAAHEMEQLQMRRGAEFKSEENNWMAAFIESSRSKVRGSDTVGISD